MHDRVRLVLALIGALARAANACDGAVYWLDGYHQRLERSDPCTAGRTSLWTVPLPHSPTCTDPELNLIGAVDPPFPFESLVGDIDGGWLYWVDVVCHDIYRGRMDGSGEPEVVVDRSSDRRIHTMAWDPGAKKIYWAEVGLPLGSDRDRETIWRADPDGSSTEPVFLGARPLSLAVDTSHRRLYFTDRGTTQCSASIIRWVPTDQVGSPTTIVPLLQTPQGMAVDPTGEWLYYTDADDGFAFVNLWRVRFDGSGRERLFDSVSHLIGPVGPMFVDVGSDRLWIGTKGAIVKESLHGEPREAFRCDSLLSDGITRGIVVVGTTRSCACCGDGSLNDCTEQCDDGNLVAGDGCDSTCFLEASASFGQRTVPPLATPRREGVETCGGTLYWGDGPRGTIERANVCGANRQALWGGPLRSATSCGGLDQDLTSIVGDPTGGWLYWADRGSCSDIYRGALDGSGQPQLLVDRPADAQLSDVVWDPSGRKLYWVEQVAGDHADRRLQVIWQANEDGTNPEKLIGGLHAASLGVDPARRRLYFTDRGDGCLSGAIQWLPLDGPIRPTQLIAGLAFPQGLVADPIEDVLYFAEATDGAGDVTLWRMKLDGSDRRALARHLAGPIHHMAIDRLAGVLYAANGSTVKRVPLDGGVPADVLCSGIANTTSVALVGTGAGCTCCGDGVTNGCLGEICDSGDAAGDECCDAACRGVARGTPCDDQPCMTDTCDGHGACAHVVASDAGCAAGMLARSTVRVDRRGRKIGWHWEGDAALDDFGKPLTSTDGTLCLIDTQEGTPQLALAVPLAAGAAWRPLPKGFRYRADGAQLTLRSGASRRGRIDLAFRGPGADRSITKPLTLRLERRDSPICFDSRVEARRKGSTR